MHYEYTSTTKQVLTSVKIVLTSTTSDVLLFVCIYFRELKKSFPSTYFLEWQVIEKFASTYFCKWQIFENFEFIHFFEEEVRKKTWVSLKMSVSVVNYRL